jgi:2-polyprenyl-3-methyl-5-hydroxy-6-metoxy-1,4-benzoquinol methylase
MFIIQQIIKCPVCNQIIGTDALSCAACQSLSPQKITKNLNRLATFIDFHPERQESNLKLEHQKQQDFITQLFDNSFLPWFYEKILPLFWAMGLRGWGGIEKEALEVSKFFGQDPEIVMDLSCGTGIMARKLAKSQFYQLIIALDYSEEMLKMLTDDHTWLEIDSPTTYISPSI